MVTRNTLLAVLLLLGACDRPAGDQAASRDAAKNTEAVAPAIIPPDEVADPTTPPSYEVAIAAAAAAHNKAEERCATQPESVRTQCEQEANAAFAETRASIQDLRGNQP